MLDNSLSTSYSFPSSFVSFLCLFPSLSSPCLILAYISSLPASLLTCLSPPRQIIFLTYLLSLPFSLPTLPFFLPLFSPKPLPFYCLSIPPLAFHCLAIPPLHTPPPLRLSPPLSVPLHPSLLNLSLESVMDEGHLQSSFDTTSWLIDRPMTAPSPAV